ncbi:MAG: hypothetical protein ACXWXQ_06905 [Actinomycetota bacterium]
MVAEITLEQGIDEVVGLAEAEISREETDASALTPEEDEGSDPEGDGDAEEDED